MKKFLSVFCTCLSLACNSFAAEIEKINTGTAVDLIVLKGEIEVGDAKRFQQLAQNTSHAAVLFESPGGNLLEGIAMGEIIRQHGYSSGVAPGTACASACALAWLAGEPRYMDPSALVGFHAAFTDTDGVLSESGVGNAIVGAYLTNLGLSYAAVIFVTSAKPEDMNWLNPAEAKSVGISLTLIDSEGTEIEAGSQVHLKLPSGFRWIVLESSLDSERLRYADTADVIVGTQNGYFASVLGPFEQALAEHMLATDSNLPSDAYLSSGNGFLFSID